MTPGEVQGLQALAVAGGGSLTKNPDTGLPEAGFLESLLPTLIGAGLTVFSGGAINPLTAGFITGGIETARTGDLGRGLMAGLGAYGGAGVGSALSSAGAATNAATAQQAAMETLGTTGGAGFAGSGAAADAAIQQEVARQGLAQAPTTAMGNLAQAGQGAQSLFSSGAAGDTARTAAMEGFGTYSGLEDRTLGALGTTSAAAIGPATYIPPYEAPESGGKSNYEGPYLPTERTVRFPGEGRAAGDSSEFRYFDTINPYPGFYTAAEGGTVAPEGGGDFASRFAAIQAGTPSMGSGDFASRLSALQAAPAAAPAPGLASAIRSGNVEGFGTPAPQTTGMTGERSFGFRPLAEQVPVIEQAAAEFNPEVKTVLDNRGDGGDPGNQTEGGYDMGYVPGIAAGFGRAVNQGLPSTFGVVGDLVMSAQGYEYNPVTRDYEQKNPKDFEDVTTVSGSDDPAGGYNSYSDEGKAASDRGDTFFRAGGMTMDNGGFVIDAHTVSEIGNGSSDAGHERLSRLGGEPIQGPGDGVSDSIKANIGGVQEARIARDESYLSRDDVKALGGGNLKKGEKMLYKLMAEAHKSRKKKGRGQATGLDKLITRMATA